jgi:hypothetical protein
MGYCVRKPITYAKVYYDFLPDCGIEDPYCWECTSHKARTNNGYIQANRDGFRFMHQWVYWKETGEIPEVLEMACGNRICLNPAHMVAKTVEEAKRSALRAAHDRPPVPYGHMSKCRLGPEKVEEVRKMLTDGCSHIEIGRKLGVDYRIVRGIAIGTMYKHG